MPSSYCVTGLHYFIPGLVYVYAIASSYVGVASEGAKHQSNFGRCKASILALWDETLHTLPVQNWLQLLWMIWLQYDTIRQNTIFWLSIFNLTKLASTMPCSLANMVTMAPPHLSEIMPKHNEDIGGINNKKYQRTAVVSARWLDTTDNKMHVYFLKKKHTFWSWACL